VALFGRFGRRGGGEGALEGTAPIPPVERSAAVSQPQPGSAWSGPIGGSVDPERGGGLGFDALSPGAETAWEQAGEVQPARVGGFPTQEREAAPEPRREVGSMVLCTRCGHANPEGSRFCSNCGNPLVAGAVPAEPRAGERPTEVTSTIALGALGLSEQGDTGEIVRPHASETEALAESNALLVVQRGPNAGSRFLLDADVTSAGRAPDSDIFLDDVTVSRRHAEFTRAAQGYLVRDVGSLNGTYVNRERIEEVLLADGDEVQIGKYRLVFLTGRG
jgi:FHA domain/zinc-ribbon domain